MKLKLSSFLCQILLEISVALTEFISSTLECSSSLIFSFAPSKYPLIFSGTVWLTAAVLRLVTQSYLTICDPMHCSCQAPLSVGFSRQEYWSGLPCFPSGDLPNPGIKPSSPALQVDYLLSESSGKPVSYCYFTTTQTLTAVISHGLIWPFMCPFSIRVQLDKLSPLYHKDSELNWRK